MLISCLFLYSLIILFILLGIHILSKRMCLSCIKVFESFAYKCLCLWKSYLELQDLQLVQIAHEEPHSACSCVNITKASSSYNSIPSQNSGKFFSHAQLKVKHELNIFIYFFVFFRLVLLIMGTSKHFVFCGGFIVRIAVED